MLFTPTSYAAEYRLPFAGTWFVMAGGDTLNVNHHMSEPSQWYGIDFMMVGGPENRSITKSDGKSLEDYYSWDQRILSPVSGVVRKVHDGEEDNPIGARDEKNAFGNYVVIQSGKREFVYLAHFQKGSIRVKEGQRIATGRLLGLCGNSGNSDGPHIHMHVQDQLKPYTGMGQNITFKGIDVLLTGKKFINVKWPLIQGLFVRNHKRTR